MPGPRGLAPISNAQSASWNTLYGSMPILTCFQPVSVAVVALYSCRTTGLLGLEQVPMPDTAERSSPL